jgi:putative signal transducing protein
MARLTTPAHHRPTMFTTVAHYTDPIEAHLARGRLQSEGIDAHLGDEHLAMANWEWRLAVGGVKLRVAERDAERARAVLRAMDAGEYALDSDGDEARALQAPDRESWSSRLAWAALMLFAIPLPWRRRARDDRAQRRL